jgi:hypothetical protein
VGPAKVVLGAWALAAGICQAQPYVVEGNCRDGQPHGSYELRDGKGTVRAVGAFNRGKRTGSFLFWSSGGVRIAHLPFEDDALSGTLALWYADRPARAERRKLEATYARGRLNGAKRSWYPDGRVRAEYGYERGELRSASATAENGRALGEPDARALAARDAAADDAFVASLVEIVASNLPQCDAASPGKVRNAALTLRTN